VSQQKVAEYVENNKSKFVARLQTFCRQPSVSSTGRGIRECAELLNKMMNDVGISSKIVEVPGGNPVVYGEVRSRSSKKTIIFYNHYDVQPPEPLELWKSDPFSAEIRDGTIYARGVADNKGMIVARMSLVETFLNTLRDLPMNIKFVVEGEEEIGSPHLSTFVRNNRDLLRGNVIMWEDGSWDSEGRPVVSLGLKGVLYVELRVKSASRDIHSSEAVIVPNAAWRLLWALDTLKGQDERILIGGFRDDIKPFSPEEIKLIKSMPFDEEERKKSRGLSGFLLGLRGDELKLRFFGEPTCNICGLQTGYTGKGLKTVLPNEAMAKLDFRLVPDQRPDDILLKLKKHLARHGFADITVESLAQLSPSRTPISDKYATTAIKVLGEVYGKQVVVEPINPGSGPRFLFERDLGIPVISGAGADHLKSNIHAPNENVTLDGFLRAVEGNAAVINGIKDL